MQTYRNLELIIVDDASKDGTEEAARAAADPRARYIRSDVNLGIARALNAGFAQSQGDYLTWTSDDNRYGPEAIDSMARFLRQHPEYDFVCADYWAESEDGNRKLQHVSGGDGLWSGNGIGPCFLYTRVVHETVGMYDPELPYVEDYDYWLRVHVRFRIGVLRRPLYYYGEHARSVTARGRTMPGRVAYYHCRLYEKLKRTGLRDLAPDLRRQATYAVHEAWASWASRVGQAALQRGDRAAAVRWQLRALGISLRGPVSRKRLAVWYIGQVLDGVLPSPAMAVARRVKRQAEKMVRIGLGAQRRPRPKRASAGALDCEEVSPSG